MTKAFLDTTILVDLLLGAPAKQEVAKDLIGKYSETQVPAYAFKEMRSGPLSHLVFTYNLLASRDTFEEVTSQLSRLSQFQARRFSVGMTSIVRGLVAASATAQTEEDKKRSVQAWLLREIQKAWRRRRRVTSKVVAPLACLVEDDYELRDGRLRTSIGSQSCTPGVPCSAALHLKGRASDVQVLVHALRPKKKGEFLKREWSSRRSALKEVLKHRAGEVPRKHCRAFGDAYICLMAPSDSVILTTNKVDFEPLSKALGKKVAP